MEDQSISPRPDVEHGSHPPHGNSGEEAPIYNDQSNDNFPDQSLMDFDRENYQDDHDPMKDILQTTELSNDLDFYDQGNGEQDLNYGVLPQGLSDDENVDKAFDRSWSGQQARKTSPKSKKSPRKSDSGTDEEASPRTKKARHSLFGGPEVEMEDGQPEDYPIEQYAQQSEGYLLEQSQNMIEPPTPGQGIRNCMTSLNLEQQGRDVSPAMRPFNSGFDLATSERGSMSPGYSRAASEESIIIPPDNQPLYELRQNIDRNKTFTYVDQDNSGNFDPSEEAKQKILKLNKAKAAKAAKAVQRSKKGKQRAPKETVMKRIVSLPFESFGNVRNITNDEDNWPDDWSYIDSDTEREMQEYRDFFRSSTPGLSRHTQISIEDPCGEVDDLTGYPVARGCNACRKRKVECSMIAGGSYPCQHCENEGKECELIIPPTQKGRCKQCSEDSNVCSFENDPDQAICDHCADNELICDALPPKGYRAERIDITEILYGPDRLYTACTVCRKEKKRCSLKKKTDKPPCKYCKKNNIGCTFYDLPKIEKNKGKAKAIGPTEGDVPEVSIPSSKFFSPEDLMDMDSRNVQIESRSPTPEVEMEDHVGHKGTLTKIKTSFSHPIQFGVVENTTDCNFCELPVYGFVGLFEREVHVIRWYNGLGFTEVGGGHAENNGPTTMCQTCAMGRTQIIGCHAHEIQHMFPDGTAPDNEEVFSGLLSIEEASPDNQIQLQRWCSMCFTPASFKCCTRQVSMFSGDDEDIEIEGCGLRLCNPCEFKLREVFGGDSSVMAETLDHETKPTEQDEELIGQVIRADIGLLGRDGLLMRALNHAAEQAEF